MSSLRGMGSVTTCNNFYKVMLDPSSCAAACSGLYCHDQACRRGFALRMPSLSPALLGLGSWKCRFAGSSPCSNASITLIKAAATGRAGSHHEHFTILS